MVDRVTLQRISTYNTEPLSVDEKSTHEPLRRRTLRIQQDPIMATHKFKRSYRYRLGSLWEGCPSRPQRIEFLASSDSLPLLIERLKLHLKQAVVHLSQRHELLMGALFGNFPLMEHHNAVGVSHGVESVRHQQRGST